MINSDVLLLILGMTVVTYIPRMLPAVLIDKMRFGPKTEKFLNLIPYTAMAALIFPGILSVDAARPEIGILGGLAAGVLAWKKCSPMICVLAAIGVDLILYTLF
ncbi:MAG: AzlD domain-containing protein [Lachnospiraceae bacterium]|nr:AzlD domain-containing protein [Lachnospiraceae bacterium]